MCKLANMYLKDCKSSQPEAGEKREISGENEILQ
jgi:hypothetical protein